MITTTPVQTDRQWMFPFFTIWIGQAFSLFGTMLVQFALVWWLTQTTGSATVLATATLVALLPGVFLGPFAGALVDRWNRRVVMIVADSAIALAVVVLVYLFWVGAVQVWHVYLIMFVRAVGGTFHWPAMQASTSLMVPREQLSRVAGLNQTLHGALNIVAPPTGALLLAVLPMHSILAIDVVTAALAVISLGFVRIPQPPRLTLPGAAGGVRPSLQQDLIEGFRFIWHWPGVLLLLLMATLINFLLNPAFSLLPILVTRHFGGGALELGWIESVAGIGTLLGGLTLSVWGGFRRRILTSFTGIVGIGAGTLLIGLTPAMAFGMALVAIFVATFMGPIANGPLMAVMQAVVPPAMQGRVFTVTSSLAAAMSPIGMAIAGPVADWLGVQFWFIVGGIICLSMGIVAFFIPALVHLGEGGVIVSPETTPPEGEAALVTVAPAGLKPE